MWKHLIVAIFFIASPSMAYAATGDIIYNNCGSGSCTGAGSMTGWTRTVETIGCKSGECLKLVGTFTGTKYGDGTTSISTSGISGKNEITVTYWVKLSESARGLSGGNLKGFRPLIGSAYYFATENSHFSWDYYASYNVGLMTITDKVVDIKVKAENADYSEPLGGYDYYNTGRFDINFNAGGHDGFGAYWTKVRHWIKLPSTVGGSDGQSKLWINEELIATFTEQSTDALSTTFSGFNFYPSSEASEAFEHWMDEMIVYEGYVPPSGVAQNGRMQAGSFSGAFR